MRPRKLFLVLVVIALLTPLAASAASTPALRIGPVEGLTTRWHRAPESTAIPAGSVVEFRIRLLEGASVQWEGARVVSDDGRWSTAEWIADGTGSSEVTAVYVHADGQRERRSCRLEVIRIRPEEIRVSNLALSVDSMVLDPDDMFGSTYHYFTRPDSIAVLERIAEDSYVTSTSRLLFGAVDVDPPEIAPLIEWRPPVGSSLGRDTSMFWQGAPRVHEITVGPPSNPLTFTVETFSTRITSHVSFETLVPEGSEVTFVAETNPPGHEDKVLWLASTRFGDCEPVRGRGPTFTTRFDDTWGQIEDGTAFQWFGVRAAERVFNQDQKLGGNLDEDVKSCARNSTDDKVQSNRVGTSTGNGCGACGSQCASTPPAPGDPQDTGDPVAIHSGEATLRRVDLVVPGRGIDWEFSRRYRSRINFSGPLGRNWEFNHHSRLILDPASGDLDLLDGNARSDTYEKSGDQYLSPAGFYTRLRVLDGDPTNPEAGPLEIEIINRHGVKTRFARGTTPPGTDEVVIPIASITDRNGNSIRLLYESAANPLRLTRAVDTLGRSFVYEYDANGRIKTVRDFVGREIRMTYDARGDLVSVTSPVVTGTPNGNDFPSGKTERYTYSLGHSDDRLNHNLLTVTAPNEVASGGLPRVKFIYGEGEPTDLDFDRVLGQVLGGTNASGVPAGGEIDYTYETVTGPGDAVSKTTVVDRNGNLTEYFFDDEGHPLILREHTRDLRPGDPAFYETHHFYNEDGELVETIFPEGNSTLYDYAPASDRNQQGNLISETRLPGPRGGDQAILEIAYTYEPLFNMLRSVTEERGNDPSFIPPNGGPQSAERYTTSNIFDYQEGDNLANLAAGTGRSEVEVASLLTEAGVPWSLPDQNGDGVTTSPFNACGNVVRTDEPTVRLLAGSPQAIAEGDALQEIVTTTIYNRFGQVVSETDPEENVTEYLYYPESDPDGDGSDFLSENGAGEPSDPLTGGYLRRTLRDAGSTTRVLASDIGRQTGQDPTPTTIETDYFYDPVGNTTGLLDGRGVLTEFTFNSLNQVVQVQRAASVADVASRAGGVDGSSETLSGQDFGYLTLMFYDFNDNLTRTLTENRDGNTPDGGSFPGFIEHDSVYDILDDLLQVTEEVGSAGAPTSPLFVTTQYRYDANQNPIQTLWPEGNRFDSAYDERDLLLSDTRGAGSAEGAVVFYRYDGNRNLVERTDSEDNTGNGFPESTLYEYDGFDRQRGEVDAVGNRTTRRFDPASNVVETRHFGPIGGTTPTDSAGANNVLLAQIEWLFDERSRTYQRDDVLFVAAGATPRNPVTLLDGSLSPFDDRVTTRMDHDRLDRETYTIDDRSLVEQRFYDGASRRIRRLDPEDNEVLYGYDDEDNRVRVTEIERSPEGTVPEETFITLRVFDALGRRTEIIDNLGHTDRFLYDSRDNQIGRSDAQGPPSGEFVTTSSLVEKNSPGNTTRYFFDGLDRLVATEKDLRVAGDGGGSLDLSNPFNPDGMIRTERRWDGNSRLVGRADDNGNLTQYSYDALNRQTETLFADGTRTTYTYDRDDNVRQRTDNNGTVRDHTFDGINRIVRCDITPVAGVAGTTLQAWQYDGLSRRTLAFDNNDPADVDDDAAVTFLWDSLSRGLEEVQYVGGVSYSPAPTGTQVTGPNPGLVVSGDWFADDLRVGLHYPNGREVVSTYDDLDRIKTITNTTPVHGIAQVAGYDYLGPDRVLERRYGNGTRLTFHQAGVATGYDGIKRKVRAQHLQGPSLIAGFEYGYDREDNRLFERRSHLGDFGDRMAYDSTYRLVEFRRDVTAPAMPSPPNPDVRKDWLLDGVHNWRELTTVEQSLPPEMIGTRVNQMNEYDAPSSAGGALVPDDDGLADFGALRQAHDKNGNLVGWDSSETDSFEAEYDFLNRLRTLRRASDGLVVATLLYDAVGVPQREGAGRRVRRTVTNSGDLNEDLVYLYDGARVVEEREGSQTLVQRQFVDGLWLDEHLVMDQFVLGFEGSTFYHENSQGWVQALTDGTGAVVERTTYDAYGAPRFEMPDSQPAADPRRSLVGNPYLYTGRRWDPESRFYYYRQRNYRPETGRFGQRDPLGYVDGLSLYNYARSNPIGFLDPLGGCSRRATTPSGPSSGGGGRGPDPTNLDKTVGLVAVDWLLEDAANIVGDTQAALTRQAIEGGWYKEAKGQITKLGVAEQGLKAAGTALGLYGVYEGTKKAVTSSDPGDRTRGQLDAAWSAVGLVPGGAAIGRAGSFGNAVGQYAAQVDTGVKTADGGSKVDDWLVAAGTEYFTEGFTQTFVSGWKQILGW